MISRLTVENFTLIQNIDISFGKGFHVITGETGAGKSMLIGAISLLLGKRADSDTVFDKTKKCIVEGVFETEGINIEEILEKHELDIEPQLSLRREITPQGKSRAFVNDTPVNLSVMNEIGSTLFDIHSQHENLLMSDHQFQLSLVDKFVGNEDLLSKYQTVYKRYNEILKDLNEHRAKEEKMLAEKDYLEFLFKELEEANIGQDELSELEKELQVLQNVESIKLSFSKSENLLNSSEINIREMLLEVRNSFSQVSDYHKLAQDLEKRINSVLIEIDDITSEVERLLGDINDNPERLNYIHERINTINHLCAKHKVQDSKDLMQVFQNIDYKLQEFSSVGDKIEALEREFKLVSEEISKAAEALSISRKKSFKSLSKSIVNVAAELGMPDAKFEFEHNVLEEYTPYGKDYIVSLFSANKGVPVRPLDKVASGGEMSRIMLALKSIISERKLTPIIIFDEIDTGVSGDIAMKVANIIHKMAQDIQVISISHLPQIAARAQHHFWVYKEEEDEKTVSKLKTLNYEDRVVEIAKMISGETLSDASIIAAKELLGQSL
ncbi:MAG: DNA repair protein RecN [Bacteroidales bacterium]|jgi:DNA repair protein RecN (Recombination protein N)|nr:DNA repair protein RecN [Bacteroidales bacterium]